MTRYMICSKWSQHRETHFSNKVDRRDRCHCFDWVMRVLQRC